MRLSIETVLPQRRCENDNADKRNDFGSRIIRSIIITTTREQKRYFETENAGNESTDLTDSEPQNSDKKYLRNLRTN